jgi:hypothetical protein
MQRTGIYFSLTYAPETKRFCLEAWVLYLGDGVVCRWFHGTDPESLLLDAMKIWSDAEIQFVETGKFPPLYLKPDFDEQLELPF